MYEISSFPLDSIVTPIPFEPPSKFARCLPFSKWLPKHGIKMGVKIQHCPISSKFDM
jgi:hypothetical protein